MYFSNFQLHEKTESLAVKKISQIDKCIINQTWQKRPNYTSKNHALYVHDFSRVQQQTVDAVISLPSNIRILRIYGNFMNKKNETRTTIIIVVDYLLLLCFLKKKLFPDLQLFFFLSIYTGVSLSHSFNKLKKKDFLMQTLHKTK